MSRLLNISGMKFNYLSVLSFAGNNKDGRATWLCRCDCGNETIVGGKNLRSGKTKSCGCAQRRSVTERNTRHGLAKTKEYKAWIHIKGRCLTPTDHAYANYGGRGITIALEWRDDFEEFLAHIGRAPSSKMTVDRIDNERGYEPGNVRWATRHQQTRNTRRNVYVNGVVLQDACKAANVCPRSAAGYIRRGVPPELAMLKAKPMSPPVS